MRCTRLRISILACFSLFVWFVLNRKQSGVMRSSQKIADQKSYFTPEEKELKWTVCRKLIAGQGKVGKTRNPVSDSDILTIYDPVIDCEVSRRRFSHPNLTKDEQEMPIAFSLTVYKAL